MTMTMKSTTTTSVALATLLVILVGQSSPLTYAFTAITQPIPLSTFHCHPTLKASASGDDHRDQAHESFATSPTVASSVFSRRSLLSSAIAISSSSSLLSYPISPASAAVADDPTGAIVVAGATGQTGKRILDRLLASSSSSSSSSKIIAGVRNVSKATNALSSSSSVVKDALVNKSVEFRSLDVASDSVESLASTLSSATSLIIAIGFVPSNPLQMAKAAHAVDNVGTIKLIDAAKASKSITKIVLVSSILTNGRGWGQEKSPGFVMTNAFGNVLDEKLVAENYLRNSGIDYTIVRPGGLSSKPPLGKLVIAKEDTLSSGEVSRDTVANVCVAALTDKRASNKVLEIYEDDTLDAMEFNGLNL